MDMPQVSCRSCGKRELITILSLGKTPLANALLTREQLGEKEPVFDLDLVFCPSCTLVQITETVPPETLFREYFYLSSFSETMLRHSEENVRELIESRKLNSESLVVEIASNDGYLLQYYKRTGIPVLGIEPARNIAHTAEERGIPTVCEFFDAELAKKFVAEGKRADVVHGNNVLAHVSDLNGVVNGVQLLLKDTGVAVVEVPYVKDMIDGNEFDTIYHEHLCYFSLTALDHLFRRHDLLIADVKRLDIHGGTLRIYATKQESSVRSAVVEKMLADEAAWVGNEEFYRGFGNDVERLRVELVDMLSRLKAEGKRIAVYGASAKGSTLMNYFGLGSSLLDFVVDRSTVKQGHYTPGTHLPIYSPDMLLTEKPDYVLLLTWNFADEILQQQDGYRKQGGRFIIPIPEVRVV
ncbi:MAG TPA: class I SAM-dependent methyltransferase [Pyrinomonadaceae bacterium]